MNFATEPFSPQALFDLGIYQEVFEQGAMSIFIFDENSKICYVNGKATQVLDRTASQLIGRSYLDLIDPKEQDQSIQRVRQVAQGKPDRKAHLRRLVLPDGSNLWTQIYLQLVEKDGLNYFIAQVVDISDNIKTKEALLDIELQVQMAFEAAPIGMALVAKNGKLQKANKQLCKLLDYSEEQILKLSFTDLVYPDDLEATVEEYLKLVSEEVQISPSIPKRFIDSKGNSIWTSRSVAAVHPENEPTYFVLQVEDRTSQHKMEQEVFRLAYRDPLTDVANRTALGDYVDNAVSQKIPIGLILIDLDNFKYINDSLGHGAGDALLVEFAQRIRSCVGSSGFIARLGGDEFVVALPRANYDQLNNLANKILQTATVAYNLVGYELIISASIGVTEFYDEVKGPSNNALGELLRRADLALYVAKDLGKGKVCFFEPYMYERLSEKLDLEAALRHALATDALEVEYEPIFDLVDGTCVAVEASCRWQDPQMGLILSEKFIPLAEEVGLIFQLGEFVLRQGCKELLQLSNQIGRDLNLYIRISLLQLDQAGFGLLVRDIVSSSDMAPSRLVILKEEAAPCKSFQSIHENLFQLHEAGITISLDNFGTGYSSLEHLDDCVIEQIKIDSYFVSKIISLDSQTALLETIFSISKAIGAQVAARGIETTLQLSYLRQLGCKFGQGSFLGPVGSIHLMSSIAQRAIPQPVQMMS